MRNEKPKEEGHGNVALFGSELFAGPAMPVSKTVGCGTEPRQPRHAAHGHPRSRPETVRFPIPVRGVCGTGNMALIGYARVSTKEQRVDLQLDALAKAGAEKVFEDVGISGSTTARPGLNAALSYLRPGDSLVVFKLDRLGRRTVPLLQLLADLEQRGIGFISTTEGLDTSTPVGRLVASLLASLAALEREVLIERTRHGLDAARLRGRVGGRPRALSDSQVELVQLMFKRGKSAAEIAAELGCGRSTAYRALEHRPGDGTVE
jgi:DNA invertase Pin-like site-specific DNA recombinase